MAADSRFYLGSYDDERLWFSRFTGDRSRTKVVHETVNGDDHTVQDRGRVQFRAQCSLLFDDFFQETRTPLERLNALMEKANTSDSYVLTHPVEGSFRASVGNFTYTVDDSGVITAEVEFIADGPTAQTIPVGVSAVPSSGLGSLDSSVAQLKSDLALANLPDDGTATKAQAAVDSWSAGETVPTKKVNVDTGSLSSKITGKISELSTDLDSWESLKSYVQLGESVFSAARAATTDSFGNFVMRVGTDTNLRALIANEYGADKVDAYYQRALDLNDLTTPGIIPKNTPVTLPRQAPAGRSG